MAERVTVAGGRTQSALASRTRGLAQHSLGLLLISGASLVAGLLREVVIASRYGAGSAYDAFLIASLPFEITSVMVATLGPAMVRALHEEEIGFGPSAAAALWRGLASTWAVALAVGALATAAAARPLARVIAPGLADGPLGVAAALMVVMAPSLVLGAWSAVQGAGLNARGHYWSVALAGVLLNLLMAASVYWLGKPLGPGALAAGTLAGLGGGVVLQASVSRRLSRGAVERLPIRPGAVSGFFRASWSLVLLAVLNRGFLFVERSLGSTVSAGTVAALGFASRFAVIPVAILSAVSAPLFVAMSAHSAQGEEAAVGETGETGVRATTFLVVPCVAFLVSFATPIVRALLYRGAFDAQAANLTSHVLAAFAVGIVAWVGADLCTRVLWAHGAYLRSLVLAAVFVSVDLVVALALRRPLGAVGIALARSIAFWSYFVLALVWVARMSPAFDLWRVVRSLAIHVAVAGVLVVAARVAYRFLGAEALPTIPAVAVLGLVFGIICMGYLTLLAGPLGLSEARRVRDFLVERLRLSLRLADRN